MFPMAHLPWGRYGVRISLTSYKIIKKGSFKLAFVNDENRTFGSDGCITDDGYIVNYDTEYESDGCLFD